MDMYKFTDKLTTAELTAFILAIVLAIFILCTLVDKVRMLLFRIFKTDKIAEGIEKLIKSTVNKAYGKIKEKNKTE